MQLSPADMLSDLPGRTGQIAHVEYQGAYVVLTLQPDGTDQETLHISQTESAYLAHPLQVNDSARASWHIADAHLVKASPRPPTAA
jgi:hypothetical protein